MFSGIHKQEEADQLVITLVKSSTIQILFLFLHKAALDPIFGVHFPVSLKSSAVLLYLMLALSAPSAN